MDDLQLNISVSKKVSVYFYVTTLIFYFVNGMIGFQPQNKGNKRQPSQKNTNEYKFKSKPDFSGTIIARKRPQNASSGKFSQKNSGEPQNKIPKVSNFVHNKKDVDLQSRLRDLSENKGKYQGKNYQEISDDLQLKQKPRSGPWISSLFKNNPDVPKMGQKAVKPVVEKVFAGKTFSDLNIHPHSIANLKQNLNLTELMTVQQKAIPIILQGRDVLIRYNINIFFI